VAPKGNIGGQSRDECLFVSGTSVTATTPAPLRPAFVNAIGPIPDTQRGTLRVPSPSCARTTVNGGRLAGDGIDDGRHRRTNSWTNFVSGAPVTIAALRNERAFVSK